ncbi:MULTISPECIES: PLP-dependent aminotransferase family protein [Cupriavidus]|uniref:PLP-dependent aminotransferase family protein n=1 Tax=Cupriavidus basilensis TaxID=68895 RepID=A0A643G4Y1_9BURK|nr:MULTISPECIES: PLP-dependent aminotransferase family protein [Cupriavidus]KUE87975.1 aminotransferase [Cupriavidus necator]NOV23743.1 PLP-dependent aminotransferase family protein [Cupriavidus necator]QOT81797.1 PLP-dependent aminotransferase family protein [Cupriavidus basilensis]BDB30350.1 PLP-dependent aminotransferase family protein [Cupriavidus sp. P-10]
MTKLAHQSLVVAVKGPRYAAWLATRNDLTARFVAAGRIPGLINLAGGLPEPTVFPTEELATYAREVILKHPQDCLGYAPTDGLPELRDAIATRYSSPVLRLRRENVLLTASGTQSLDLIGKVLIEQGDVIAAQFPSYVGAMDAWRPRAPRYRNLVLEDDAFDPLSSFEGAQFVYSVPNFSNPTGRLVGVSVRNAMVDAAHRTGVWLVEDDPYCALQYEGVPLPRMIELSAERLGKGGYEGPIIHLGSVSKELAPGLRVGWIIAAPQMIQMLSAAKQGADLCSSGLNQRIALAAIDSGLMERLSPRMVELYRERRDALCAAMAEHLAEWFVWEVPVGGMFVWATARDPSMDTDRLVSVGTEVGVLAGPGSAFDPWVKSRNALRLNFTANSPERLAEGVRRLAQAVRKLKSAGV